MLSLSPAKLLVVLVVALIVLGPEKLPQVARQLGAFWGDIRKWRTRLESEVRSSFPDLPPTHEVVQAVRSPLSFLDRLADAHENSSSNGDTPAPGAQNGPDADSAGPVDATESGGTQRDAAGTNGERASPQQPAAVADVVDTHLPTQSTETPAEVPVHEVPAGEEQQVFEDVQGASGGTEATRTNGAHGERDEHVQDGAVDGQPTRREIPVAKVPSTPAVPSQWGYDDPNMN
jgi:sec-independent protein translocase protein TatB